MPTRLRAAGVLLLLPVFACSAKTEVAPSSGDAAPAVGDDAGAGPGGHDGGGAGGHGGGVALSVAYEGTTDGLRLMVTDLLRAVSENDARRRDLLLASLRLPHYREWFDEHFGPVAGERLAAEYLPFNDDIGLLAPVIARLEKDKQANIAVSRYATASDTGAVIYQSNALAAMKKPAPLYSVRFSDGDGKRTFHLWSFVYAGGTFRYVGKLKTVGASQLSAPDAGAELDPGELRPTK